MCSLQFSRSLIKRLMRSKAFNFHSAANTAFRTNKDDEKLTQLRDCVILIKKSSSINRFYFTISFIFIIINFKFTNNLRYITKQT